MSELLDRVYEEIGTTTKTLDWGNRDAIADTDRVEVTITFYAGDDRVVTAHGDGSTIPTLGSIHDFSAAMENLFMLKLATALREEYGREAAEAALSELTGGGRSVEDILGIEGI